MSDRFNAAPTPGPSRPRNPVGRALSASSSDEFDNESGSPELETAREHVRTLEATWNGHVVRVIALQQLENALSELSVRQLEQFWEQPGHLSSAAVQALIDAEPDPVRRQNIINRNTRLQQTRPFTAQAEHVPAVPEPTPAPRPSPASFATTSPASATVGTSTAGSPTSVYPAQVAQPLAADEEMLPPYEFELVSTDGSESSASFATQLGSDEDAEMAIDGEWATLSDRSQPLEQRVQSLYRMTSHLHALSVEGRFGWLNSGSAERVMRVGLDLLEQPASGTAMHASAPATALGELLDLVARDGAAYGQDSGLIQRLRAAAAQPAAAAVGLGVAVEVLVDPSMDRQLPTLSAAQQQMREAARRTVGVRAEITLLGQTLRDAGQPLERRIDAMSRIGGALPNLVDQDFADYANREFDADMASAIAAVQQAVDAADQNLDLASAAASALARLGEQYALATCAHPALTPQQQAALEALAQTEAGRRVGLAADFDRSATDADSAAAFQQARADASMWLQTLLNQQAAPGVPPTAEPGPQVQQMESQLQTLHDTRVPYNQRVAAAAAALDLVAQQQPAEAAVLLRGQGRELLLGLIDMAEATGTEDAYAQLAQGLRLVVDAEGFSARDAALVLVGDRDDDSPSLTELEDALVRRLIRLSAEPAARQAGCAVLVETLVTQAGPALDEDDRDAVADAWQQAQGRAHQEGRRPEQAVPTPRGHTPEQAAVILARMCQPADEVARPARVAAVARMLVACQSMPPRAQARVLLDPDAAAGLVRLAVSESLRPPAGSQQRSNGAAFGALVSESLRRALTQADDAQVVAAMVGRGAGFSTLQELAPGRGHRNLQPLAALIFEDVVGQRHPELLVVPVRDERGRAMPLRELLAREPNVGRYPHPDGPAELPPNLHSDGRLQQLSALIQRNAEPQRRQQQRVQAARETANRQANARAQQARAEREHVVVTAQARLDQFRATNQAYHNRTQEQYQADRDHSAQIRAAGRDERDAQRRAVREQWAAAAGAFSLYAGAMANYQVRLRSVEQADVRHRMLQAPQSVPAAGLPAPAVPALPDRPLHPLASSSPPALAGAGDAAAIAARGPGTLRVPHGSTMRGNIVTVPAGLEEHGHVDQGRLELRLLDSANLPALVLPARPEPRVMVDAITGEPVPSPAGQARSLTRWTPPPSTFSARDVQQLASGVAVRLNQGRPEEMHLLADRRIVESMTFHGNSGGRLEIHHAPPRAAVRDFPAQPPAHRERDRVAASVPSSPAQQRIHPAAGRVGSAPPGERLAERNRHQRLREAAAAATQARGPEPAHRRGMQR
ncbi:hypothetical protein RZA67_02635 [Stenotrophomonas sp. C3(2023)]|uniref:hypothetical protein n=1 Tax=Stenotrophomonas sp. C3(2023) TaxID=3080277 RepID=UPI00293D15E8|nr:hypothetical protein [Stenotrophomonas sp. C3(2023)]MDV3467639.1 hypothetical protein [Stenotrophomonas sp. C3(2023)]